MLLVYREHNARKQHMLTWCRQAGIGGGGVGAVLSFASGESPPALSRQPTVFIGCGETCTSSTAPVKTAWYRSWRRLLLQASGHESRSSVSGKLSTANVPFQFRTGSSFL